MPVPVETFRHQGTRHYGTTLFKALGHPKAVVKARELVGELKCAGPVAVVDPNGTGLADRASQIHLPVGCVATRTEQHHMRTCSIKALIQCGGSGGQ